MNNSRIAETISQRNYGIDLLRLIAAFYVVVLHTLGIGGIIGATTPHTYQNYICRLLIIFTFSAVNIFGIISGYVGYRESEKKSSSFGYLSLWLTVVFYCVLYTVIFHCFQPGVITWTDLAFSCFPVTNNLYWYFSAYTLVYFLSPFLNKAIRYSSDKELKHIFCLICFILVFIEYVGQSFNMGNGYTAIWLLLLYFIGGIMKKTGIGSSIPSYVAFLGICFINFGLFYLGLEENSRIFFIFFINLDYDHSYISPFFLTTAILHVIIFSRLRVCKPFQKIIRFAAPAAFSIYIVNTNKTMWQHFMYGDYMQGILTSWAHSSPFGIIARVMCFSFVFVIAVVVIDFFRQRLFHLLNIPSWPQKLSGLLQKDKTV